MLTIPVFSKLGKKIFISMLSFETLILKVQNKVIFFPHRLEDVAISPLPSTTNLGFKGGRRNTGPGWEGAKVSPTEKLLSRF